MPSNFKNNFFEHCHIFSFFFYCGTLPFFFFNTPSTLILCSLDSGPFILQKLISQRLCHPLLDKTGCTSLDLMFFDVLFIAVEPEFFILVLYYATLWIALMCFIYYSLYHFIVPFSSRFGISFKGLLIFMHTLFNDIYLWDLFFILSDTSSLMIINYIFIPQITICSFILNLK